MANDEPKSSERDREKPSFLVLSLFLSIHFLLLIVVRCTGKFAAVEQKAVYTHIYKRTARGRDTSFSSSSQLLISILSDKIIAYFIRHKMVLLRIIYITHSILSLFIFFGCVE